MYYKGTDQTVRMRRLVCACVDLKPPKGFHTARPIYATVKMWVAKYKNGRQSHDDDASPEIPLTVATPEMVN